MYKLHRKMIHGVSGGRISVRFDTGFGEEKCESYYCVLTSSSATDKLHVTEHSIPFFLPLRELEKAHLATSPRVFIDYVGDILQAYVSRREQVREVKETKGEHIGELYHSLSFSLIELMLKEPHCQVCVIGNLFSHIYTQRM
jgi:centromere protein O